MSGVTQPAGWYPADGDPPGTVRWWDGQNWVGGPQQQGAQQQAGYVAPGAGTLSSGRELADPWLRVAATIIDAIVLLIPGVILLGASFAAILAGGGGGADTAVSFGASIALAILGALYYYLMNSFVGGTLGKLAVGIRIADADGNEPIGPSVGFIRSLMNIIPILSVIPILGWLIQLVVAIVGLVSLVFLFTDPEHRTVMDRAADTYVVKKR